MSNEFGSHEQLGSHFSGPHKLDNHQLLYAEAGVLKISTKSATWTLPPHRGAWIQAGVEHSLAADSADILRVRFEPQRVRSPARLAVFEVPALARELIRSTVESEPDDPYLTQVAMLLAALSSDRWVAQQWEYYLPVPVTPEVVAATQAAMRNLGIDLKEAARIAKCSPRTLTRRFQDDIGVPWRSFLLQARMTRALEILERGGNVTDTCHEVGYASLGAFSNTFYDFYGFRPSGAKRRK